ncbi:ATP-dependent DNA helicase RecQ [Alkalibacterium subtropicum]|uniref:ATP-dependent DNA helicase RecQ n=1 Tax=Alkalibacterium subtropicum TaxID=753702 RepID=A0A1I1ETR2_9LACT|nr:RecQ family ATP-dependent DNA helicase [Alkalibacterium subtropicum]SFB88283.1 ATP-dependent DNA helicase RecQ [Alkalibacterium subtropicum]
MDDLLEKQMYDMLESKFGFSSFRPGQKEAIKAALTGRDSLVMLPTGTGKSLCYQLPSYFMTGATLIVSPLLSLMEDQVETMKKNGEKSVVALNSFMSQKEKKLVMNSLNTYKFIFMSPEMLQQERVLTRLKQVSISLLVVDEAHCISQWGMDFRPDYLRLGDLKNQLSSPLTMALTATAVEAVRQEIIRNLNLNGDVKEVIYSVNRPTIQLRVEQCVGDKDSKLFHAINTFGRSGIIYFSSKKIADKVATRIRETTGFSAESYHSDIEAKDKKKIQAQFLTNELDIICATSAFGMGIDKPDIRYVIHYHMPANPEMYLQEIGRASRDQQGGIALLLYEAGDEHLQNRLQEESLPEEEELRYAYRHPKALEALKDDSKSRLARYFVSRKTAINEALERIEERKRYKKQQLRIMVQYASTESCKREMLLNYFNEELQERQNACCSSCESKLPLPYNKQRAPIHKKLEGEQTWEVILNKLFNFNLQPKK